jgi:hypothetical protein
MRVVTHQKNEKGDSAPPPPPTKEEIEEFGETYVLENKFYIKWLFVCDCI